MSSISTQFYALENELVDFIDSISKTIECYLVNISESPFKATLFKSCETLQRPISHVAMFRREPGFLGAATNDFFKKNPNAIHLFIGSHDAAGLSESWFTVLTEDDDTFILAKKIVTRLKKITKAGVVFKNLETDKEGMVKTYRYTAMVKEEQNNGLRLLGMGKNIIAYIP